MKTNYVTTKIRIKARMNMEDLQIYQTECETSYTKTSKNIRCRDRKLYLSHSGGGSLEPENEQIDASPVQIHGSSSAPATDLAFARSL